MKFSLSIVVVAAALAAAVLINAAPLPNQLTEVRSSSQQYAVLYQRNGDQLVGRGLLESGKSGIEVLDQGTHASPPGRELADASTSDSKAGDRPSSSHEGSGVHASIHDVDTELSLSNYPAAKRQRITATGSGAQHARNWEGVDTELRLSSTAPADQRAREPDHMLVRVVNNDRSQGKHPRADDVMPERIAYDKLRSEFHRLGEKHVRIRKEIRNVADTIYELSNDLNGPQSVANLMRIRQLKRAIQALTDGADEAYELWFEKLNEKREATKALIDAGGRQQ